MLVRRDAGVEAEVVGRGILLRLRPVRGVLRLSDAQQTHGEQVAQAVQDLILSTMQDASMEWQMDRRRQARERLAQIIDAQGISTQTPMSHTEEPA